MNTRKKQDSGVLAVMDAVEALESIVDLEFEREVELATQEEIQMQNHEVIMRTAKWTGGKDANKTAELIKQTFHVILHYLKNFYNHEPKQANEPKTAERAKTIMVLVGEAAQKLDKYTTIFNKTKTKHVKSSKEYKQLQEFYLTRIARKIDDSILGKWIFELSQGAMTRWAEKEKVGERKPISTKYVFIDLESVKKDTEYELFFLRKEDGTRFFNPRLIRNIKLVCDFGETIQKEKTTDPLTDIKVWQDHAFHIASKEILHSLGNALNNHFRKTAGSAKRELIGELNKALFALLLCSNPKNLQRNMPEKTCSEYFMDFHYFLRKALSCREYQQLIAYGPKQSETISHATLDLIQLLCRSLFTSIRSYQELIPVFEKVFIESREAQSPEHEKAAKDSHMLWSSLAAHYAALKKLSKQHPHGPLEKVLEILEIGNYHVFDPIMQSNTPFQLYSLFLDEHKMTNIRIPSPIAQEFIQKASVLEEFKSFLRTYSKGEIEKKHLLFNLQDRTSWKDHARSIAIEELQNNPQTQNALVVVTLSKDTEFYNLKIAFNC